MGWSYEQQHSSQAKTTRMRPRRLDAAQLSETDLANAASILRSGKASARVSVSCTATKEYHSSPQEMRDLATAERISHLGEASLLNPAPLADGTKLPKDVHNTRLLA